MEVLNMREYYLDTEIGNNLRESRQRTLSYQSKSNVSVDLHHFSSHMIVQRGNRTEKRNNRMNKRLSHSKNSSQFKREQQLKLQELKSKENQLKNSFIDNLKFHLEQFIQEKIENSLKRKKFMKSDQPSPRQQSQDQSDIQTNKQVQEQIRQVRKMQKINGMSPCSSRKSSTSQRKKQCQSERQQDKVSYQFEQDDENLVLEIKMKVGQAQKKTQFMCELLNLIDKYEINQNNQQNKQESSKYDTPQVKGHPFKRANKNPINLMSPPNIGSPSRLLDDEMPQQSIKQNRLSFNNAFINQCISNQSSSRERIMSDLINSPPKPYIEDKQAFFSQDGSQKYLQKSVKFDQEYDTPSPPYKPRLQIEKQTEQIYLQTQNDIMSPRALNEPLPQFLKCQGDRKLVIQYRTNFKNLKRPLQEEQLISQAFGYFLSIYDQEMLYQIEKSYPAKMWNTLQSQIYNKYDADDLQLIFIQIKQIIDSNNFNKKLLPTIKNLIKLNLNILNKHGQTLYNFLQASVNYMNVRQPILIIILFQFVQQNFKAELIQNINNGDQLQQQKTDDEQPIVSPRINRMEVGAVWGQSRKNSMHSSQQSKRSNDSKFNHNNLHKPAEWNICTHPNQIHIRNENSQQRNQTQKFSLAKCKRVELQL
ncbi:UNKNOWN [Stylonychia lemnae]|uniref:Uncharacterized protein n=1 Tax=Stylonychia lemnae TaxID=5949 RepID=A0A078AWQ5_STYLE|nr:UNKNOWN [Stylonychia lemnae]|eukprot:CDW85243.1 UNKNOWN [Stylonychia lemnae]